MESNQQDGAAAGRDVRMRGFASRTSVEEAYRWIDSQSATGCSETIPLNAASGRVLAQAVHGNIDVPGFDRAMMDGFAVRANETHGATAYNPLELAIVGKSLPGRPFVGKLHAGQAVRIMTGAPLPEGADAVLPAELGEVRQERLLAQGEVTPGKHLGLRGEDITKGAQVLPAFRKLRPQDIGVLASLGMAEVEVIQRPSVHVIITGNELVRAEPSCNMHGPPRVACPPPSDRIYDANGPMLSALVIRDGGCPLLSEIVPDRPQALREALEHDAGLTILAGGSSVGEEDHAPLLLAELGELAIHGIAIRPSSPTGMGRIGQRLVFLLPGNPVSCLCAYDFFAGRAVRWLASHSHAWPYRSVVAPLQRKLSSVIGRVDYARVRLTETGVEPISIGGASILTSTTRADGFVVVPADLEGYPAGASVRVWLYD